MKIERCVNCGHAREDHKASTGDGGLLVCPVVSCYSAQSAAPKTMLTEVERELAALDSTVPSSPAEPAE